MFRSNKHLKTSVILAAAILTVILVSFYLVQSVKADNSGTLVLAQYAPYVAQFTMIVNLNGAEIGSTYNQVTSDTSGFVTANIDVSSPIWLDAGDTVSVSFYDCAGNLLRSEDVASGPGYVNTATWTAHFDVYTHGVSYVDYTWTIDYTMYTDTYVSGVSFTPYYTITVSSLYDTPTISTPSINGGTPTAFSTALVPSGASYTVAVTSPVAAGSGARYTCTSSTSQTYTATSDKTVTFNWQLQYYLTVTGTYSTTTGEGWYNAGATANFDVSSPTTPSGGSRYAFSAWTGYGSGSYSGTTKASSCTMNEPITEYASWSTQYQLTVSSAYGTTTGGGWYNLGETAYAGLTSNTSSGGTGVRYNFVSWSVGGTNATQSNPIVMYASTTVTASWSTQYYLTVTSPYGLPTSGTEWYNSGATAYAGVSTNIDGTHTLLGWTGDASGSSVTSNPITMTSPKTATASWTGGGGTPSGPASYNVTINGPYNENGNPASGDTTTFTLSFANNTLYQHSLTSSVGVADSIFITSTSPFIQLTWNASSTSSTLNATRVYRFAGGVNGINDTSVNLYILNPLEPAFQYTFSISDYYGMINPYLETSITPDGNHTYVVERVNLNETGGYVTFVMQQYQMYTLTFICQQGSYSQTFTASTLGTPGQLAISLNVLAGNFPTASTTGIITAYTNRTTSTSISVYYSDPSNTTTHTTWVAITISHLQGTTSITDYTANATGNAQTFTWSLADPNTDYYITVTSLADGELYTFNLVSPSISGTNPWDAIDWTNIGQYIPTLPVSYTGWGGIDPAQLIAAGLILAALGIGSYFSTAASMFISWAIAALLWKMGWWQTTAPLMVFAIVITIFVAIDEYKKGAFTL